MKALLSIVFALASYAAVASNPIDEKFINGAWLVVSNNVTYTYAQQNRLVYDFNAVGGLYAGQPNRLFWSLAASNMVPTVVSNSTSGYSPGTAYYTNFAAYDATTPYSGGVVENTNVVNGLAWVDVPGWCDANADAGQGVLTMTIKAGTAANTNTITCTFAPVYWSTNAVNYDGNAGGAAVEANDKLTLVGIGGGTSFVTVKTNLPAAFMYGVKKIRLVSVGSANNSAGSTALIDVRASGYSAP